MSRPRPQYLPPMPPTVVDKEIEAALKEGDAYVMGRYTKILRALSKKAEDGDKGAAEILLKCVVAPQRDAIDVRQTDRPSAPMPLHMRLAMFTLQRNIYGENAKPITITNAEFASLRDDTRKELEGKVTLVSELGAAPAVETVAGAAAVPFFPRAPMPVRVCQECGKEFRSYQPKAKWCVECRKKWDLQKLAAHKARRGLRMSPKLRAHLATDK